MSWLKTLADTYDLVPRERIGIPDPDDDRPEEERPVLLPICHTTNLAHIEVRITGAGGFRGASLVDKRQATTIIPCTENSANRTGRKPVNQPLADKLQYLAGDFTAYGGEVTSGYAEDPQEPHRLYISDLENWCYSAFKHPKAKAILAYLKKGTLIKDLIGAGILLVDKDGCLLREADDSNQNQGIFKLVVNQDDAFVRWRVAIPGDPDDTTWKDPTLWESWSKYYASTREKKGICYVTGKETFLAEQHPAKIRNSGDKAKLISSNDISGFTFRGRFIDADQACSVGFETTQKAHNALRWLFARQGDWNSGLVAWANSAQSILKLPPTMGADDFEDPVPANSENDSYDAGQYAALQFRNKVRGYFGKPLNASTMVVLGLDSATPGRMALTCYRELPGSEYLANLGVWHGEEDEDHVGCIAHLDYGFDKIAKRRRIFVGAPAPKDIAVACYGSRLDDKLLKDTILRLLPCIIDTAPLPWDLVSAAVERAKRRSATETWEWNKNLGITCALYRKFIFDHDKRRYKVSLDEDRDTREYLYGRLLALAERIERFDHRRLGENQRETNAERYMQRFAERPCSTWKTIELNLRPYIKRLGAPVNPYLRLMDEIKDKFTPAIFIQDEALGGEFLLGYHHQRYWLDAHQSRDGQWILRTKDIPQSEEDELASDQE